MVCCLSVSGWEVLGEEFAEAHTTTEAAHAHDEDVFLGEMV